MQSKKVLLSALTALVLMFSGCTTASTDEPDTAFEASGEGTSADEAVVSRPAIPTPPENSDHGYLVDDSRIPFIETCEEWKNFWMFSGPAVSFDVASQYPELIDLEVSTQIFVKNIHLDPDKNGIICFEDGIKRETNDVLPAGINNPALRTQNESCALEGPGLGVGFPRPRGFLEAEGTLEAVMIFVEFENVKVEEDIQEEARSYYEQFSEFIALQSGGRQQWQFTVPNEVFAIPKSSDTYRADFTDPDFGNPDFAQYFQDAVDAADSDVDFSRYDAVYVIPPKNIGTSISYGPSFPRLNDGFITSDDGSIKAGATAGNDSRLGNNSEPWAWLAHETGHLYGLSHPLDEKDNTDEFGRGLTSSNFPELYDLMTWMRTPSPDFWAWNKFWLGWLDGDQIFCADPEKDSAETFIHLTFNDREQAPGEVVLFVIPTSASTAIAVESRNLGFESRTLVYLVDVTKQDREGQIKIVPANQERIQGWLDGGLRVGESIAHGGWEFSVVQDTSKGVVLKVTGG